MTIPHLVAHRGFMDQYPENTLVSEREPVDNFTRFFGFDD